MTNLSELSAAIHAVLLYMQFIKHLISQENWMQVIIALCIFLFLQLEISYPSDVQNSKQGSMLSELAGWRS